MIFFVWAPVAQAWSWPVQAPTLLQGFSYDETHPYDSGQHRGIDIGSPAAGDAVVAPESGTVSFAGFVPTSGESVTIETADGYSVTLTHLGSIAVAKGSVLGEGDTVGTVGPSGTPEQTVPYVHLGVRLTADSLGYLDPLGLLPALEPPTPTPTPTPKPQPVPQPQPVSTPATPHAPGGGLVIERPPHVAPAVEATPVERPRVGKPKPQRTAEPKPTHAPAVPAIHNDVRQSRRPIIEPVAFPAFAATPAHGVEAEPVVLSVGPGVIAALLALLTALTRRRRPAPVAARVIELRKEQRLRQAA